MTATASESAVLETPAPWDRPGWIEDAHSWALARVPVGQVQQLREARPWSVRIRKKRLSAVMRVSTGADFLWLKEVSPAYGFEPELTRVVARHAPDFVPAVLETDGPRMLMTHAGPRMRKGGGLTVVLSRWTGIMTRYAELQIELSTVSGLLAPDSSPEELARRFGTRVDRLADAFGDSIPSSLVHLDLKNHNVCLRDGRPTFIDWGAGVLGHPFCAIVRPLQYLVRTHHLEPGGREIRRIRDAYLEPWTKYARPRELRRIASTAYALGTLCVVAAIERRVAALPISLRDAYIPRIALGLNTFAAFLREPKRLGL